MTGVQVQVGAVSPGKLEVGRGASWRGLGVRLVMVNAAIAALPESPREARRNPYDLSKRSMCRRTLIETPRPGDQVAAF